MDEESALIFKQVPDGFNRVDLWLDRFLLLGGGDGFGREGGGDGFGITVPESLASGGGDGFGRGGGDGFGDENPATEDLGGGDGFGRQGGGDGFGKWQELGGGDGFGIVLPHLIVDRLGEAVWSDVEIHMTLNITEVPADAEAREQLVRELVKELKVMQNGKLVGRGNVEATMKSINLYGIARSCQSSCFDSIGAEIDCAGTGQDGEFFTEWVDYSGYMDNESNEVYDFVSGLTWQLRVRDVGPELTYNEAVEYCDGFDMRIPSMREFLNIIDCDATSFLWQNSAYINSLWVAKGNQSSDKFVMDFFQLKSNIDMADVICVTGDQAQPEEEILYPNIDTFSGLMWLDTEMISDWQTALDTCNQLTELGFSDWRLPHLIEMGALLDRPLDIANNTFWTSTTSSTVDMTWGFEGNRQWVYHGFRKDEQHKFFCVRSIP